MIRCIGMIILMTGIGTAVGSAIASKRAVERESKVVAAEVAKALALQSSEELRRQGEAFFNAQRETKRLMLERETVNAAADKAASEQNQRDLAAARAAERRAMTELGKIRESNDGLLVVNSMLQETIGEMRTGGCTFAPGTRRLLDETAAAADGNRGAGSGTDNSDPSSATAAGATSTAEAEPPLTCEQLVRGFIALSIIKRENDADHSALLRWHEELAAKQ